jgi:serine/threonine protein kinase
VVRKVRRVTDGETLVWKEINFEKMTSREKQQLVTEVNLLKGLEHPNIVRYEDRIVDKKTSKVYIIMEYCSGGDLGTYLKLCKKKMEPIAEEVIWKISYQLLLALDHCHSRTPDERGRGGKVLHRDIKPANIFINEASHIKLGDFGLSREMG